MGHSHLTIHYGALIGKKLAHALAVQVMSVVIGEHLHKHRTSFFNRMQVGEVHEVFVQLRMVSV